jgi:hypothetical protein
VSSRIVLIEYAVSWPNKMLFTSSPSWYSKTNVRQHIALIIPTKTGAVKYRYEVRISVNKVVKVINNNKGTVIRRTDVCSVRVVASYFEMLIKVLTGFKKKSKDNVMVIPR